VLFVRIDSHPNTGVERVNQVDIQDFPFTGLEIHATPALSFRHLRAFILVASPRFAATHAFLGTLPICTFTRHDGVSSSVVRSSATELDSEVSHTTAFEEGRLERRYVAGCGEVPSSGALAKP
jgi:hypothetical protein